MTHAATATATTTTASAMTTTPTILAILTITAAIASNSTNTAAILAILTNTTATATNTATIITGVDLTAYIGRRLKVVRLLSHQLLLLSLKNFVWGPCAGVIFLFNVRCSAVKEKETTNPVRIASLLWIDTRANTVVSFCKWQVELVFFIIPDNTLNKDDILQELLCPHNSFMHE